MIKQLTEGENLKKIKTIAIYGNTGSGKTALIFSLLDELPKDRTVYFFRFPKPELLKKLNYKVFDTLEQIEELSNCVLVIDEPQLYFKFYDKRNNSLLIKLCSMCRQLNILLIMATSDTRVLTKGIESYIDLWLIKSIDYDGVKNGSKIKRILEKNALFDARGINLKHNSFIADSLNIPELNGRHNFIMPKYYTDEMSRAFLR